MTKKIRGYPQIKHGQNDGMYSLNRVKEALGIALDWAGPSGADCPALQKNIRSAIKSHGGAMRHMERRRAHAKRT